MTVIASSALGREMMAYVKREGPRIDRLVKDMQSAHLAKAMRRLKPHPKQPG